MQTQTSTTSSQPHAMELGKQAVKVQDKVQSAKNALRRKALSTAWTGSRETAGNPGGLHGRGSL